MLQTYWLAVCAWSLVMTLAWMFIPERITTTSALAGLGWALAALTGRSVETVVESGESVPAAIDPALQYAVVLLAALSFLVLILFQFDAYPPESEP